MTDVVSPEERSRMMSGIRGKDTKPEMLVRNSLHKRGFRYRLHEKKLPGKPDLVFSKYNTALFINGCFWHGHDCHLFKFPKSNADFWREKIEGNRKRDEKNIARLRADGWHIIVVWECDLRGKSETENQKFFDGIESKLKTKTGH